MCVNEMLIDVCSGVNSCLKVLITCLLLIGFGLMLVFLASSNTHIVFLDTRLLCVAT